MKRNVTKFKYIEIIDEDPYLNMMFRGSQQDFLELVSVGFFVNLYCEDYSIYLNPRYLKAFEFENEEE